MPAKDLPTVRESAGKTPPHFMGPCIRVSVRVDLFTHLQSANYSMIAWKHPGATVILNEVVEGIGPLEMHVLVSDIGAELAKLIDQVSDPFPP